MSTTPPPFEKYIQLVPEADVVAAMRGQLLELVTLFARITPQQAEVQHPPYTWSLKQVIGHLIDAERVFGYRAMRFSRNDPAALPGFDENAYVAAGGFEKRTIDDLAEEFTALRSAHILMFANLPKAAWNNTGTASGFQWSVRDLARTIVGHARHHSRIIEQRLKV